jgi:hypothetical protein
MLWQVAPSIAACHMAHRSFPTQNLSCCRRSLSTLRPCLSPAVKTTPPLPCHTTAPPLPPPWPSSTANYDRRRIPTTLPLTRHLHCRPSPRCVARFTITLHHHRRRRYCHWAGLALGKVGPHSEGSHALLLAWPHPLLAFSNNHTFQHQRKCTRFRASFSPPLPHTHTSHNFSCVRLTIMHKIQSII